MSGSIAEDNAAIRVASGDGHLGVVEGLLQDRRVDPSAPNNAAINDASKKRHFDVVTRLIMDDRVLQQITS